MILSEEFACQNPIIFEEELVALHTIKFDRHSKKLQIGKVNVKNKKVED